MNTEAFQQSEKDDLIGLEEQNEISCLIRRFATEQFGYSRMRISSPELIRKMPQPRVNIALNKSLIDLYLRFGKYAYAVHKDKKYIVVARIGFRKNKNGYGTALLKELCLFGEKLGYEYLEIECPNQDCQAFMKKLGFKDEFYLPINQLKRSIQEYELLRQEKVRLTLA
ncbi:GNAT family N-acetyltransferase [Acinetobacter sp. NIPH 2699]|uniref:GNAT family N-acetyltransferase n=1 Tax=Acinetobacter sp. NIPH 2699 TaxID=2923433 RepID=UPI001F4B9536|nr:GNAT family N-acetyltransferase [Acinetobacter sp. NIPH 2699]MCH7337564.1 GNAT family N-acetyltransferase [Acinetobacter sp. NIPH 2699]